MSELEMERPSVDLGVAEELADVPKVMCMTSVGHTGMHAGIFVAQLDVMLTLDDIANVTEDGGDTLRVQNVGEGVMDLGQTIILMHAQLLDNRPYEIVEVQDWPDEEFPKRQVATLERLYLKSELGLVVN